MFHKERAEGLSVLGLGASRLTLGHPLADLGFAFIPCTARQMSIGGILLHRLEQGGIHQEEFVAEYMRYSEA